ncbi:TonB-dependent receptor [Chitinophaga pendula]|uniref:SusC/RagA family TonB-linked outer membrane protein n=1 Tax=Chitinophaga TaxID=79328 RepID=UPI000BAE9446|nr:MULTISPECIES: TonB-dependent receptor [Chitinophaga]ASZ13993.1 SusC/RagA family TonB-linked outer membrane protein [Chitinophaga sp. MD30]UCJ08383.1 TonB-dependent receptor [Chitinophaga pendula]
MKKILSVILFIFFLYQASAQEKPVERPVVRGIVRDASGPVPGVVIYEKDVTNNGTTSGPDGSFRFSLRGKQSVLVVKMVGYLMKEVAASTSPMDILIQQDVKGLEQVEVVAYGQTSKLSKTIASSSVSGDEIRRVPTASLQNALAGKLPGFISMQRSGQPGADGAAFMIRGTTTFSENRNVSPLIIVDDVEFTGNFSDIDPEQVASVTILKDAASAAVYGIKGANGVIVVTTIRGQNGKSQIRLTTNTGLQGNTIRPRFLNAYETAVIRNRALESDGLPPDWTQEDLDAWKNGTDPYGHPDIDWWGTLIRDYTTQTKNNLSINGGVDKMKYFISVGHLFQNGILKDFRDATSEVNPNYYLKRYNYRSNLDFQVTRSLDLSMDLSGYFTEQNEPNTRGRANRNRVFFELFDYKGLPAHAYPITNPDGSYGAAPETLVTGPTNNVIGRLRLGGYRRTFESDIQINLRATQRLNFIASGLKLTGLISYSSNQDFRRSLTRTNFLSFIYNSRNQTYTPFNPSVYRNEKYTLDAPASSTEKRLNTQLSLSYDTTFHNRHHVYALALLNQFSNSRGAGIPENFRGYTFRMGYNFKRKYMLEVSGAYNGTDRFKSSSRYGLFPALSGGWNIGEEPFFRDHVRFMDLFKIRGSIGATGSDDINDTYQYLYEYIYLASADYGYNFGVTPRSSDGIREGTLGNEHVSWEKELQWNIGTDMNFFKGKLSITGDVFYKRRRDILSIRKSLSDIIGIGLPASNISIISNRGFEVDLNYNNAIGSFRYRVNANVSVAKNRIEFMDEGAPAFPWLRETGGQTGRVKGYTTIGFYQDQKDIDTSAVPLGAPPRPGDLKYKDLNGDGIIDPYDQRYMDYSNIPTTNYGLTIGGDWKGLSFSVTFQSARHFTLSSFAEAVTPFFGNLREVHQGAWTPENRDSPTFPRISTLDNISNPRTNMSDYWQIRGDYVKLRNVEIAYTLPKRWVQAIRLNQVRVYANGSNLYTWMFGRNLYDVDPEVSSNTEGGVYPNQKVYNFGLNVSF